MRSQVNFRADGSVRLTIPKAPGNNQSFKGTIHAIGNFGGGAVTFQTSPDEGATKVPIKDQSGAIVSFASNDAMNIEMGNGDNQAHDIYLYATLTGSASPNLDVYLHDNRGN